MARILPLLGCWTLHADMLPEDMLPTAKAGGFSLPGAQALADFADLLGAQDEPEKTSDTGNANVGVPFPLPAMIPDAVSGSAELRCTVDFGALSGDHAVLTFDHIAGRGCVMLGEEQLAAFDSTSASYRSIHEAAELTAVPCMLAIDLTQALHTGRKETLSIRFDETRPAGLSGPVMLRAASHGYLSRMSISPDAQRRTMTLRTQINALHAGKYLLSAQPVCSGCAEEAIRESSYLYHEGAACEAEMTFTMPGACFVSGMPYVPQAIKITLSCVRSSGSSAVLCDSVTLMCGYPSPAPQYALPLTPAECMQPPSQITQRLARLHIPAARLPIPAPDALYRALTRAGVCARMADNIPLRTRLERLPCASFSAERMGEYAAVSPEASAWQMASMVHSPRTVDPALLPGELLAEAAGFEVNPAGGRTKDILAWLRAVSVRMRAEAARQGRYAGALCAPGEWNAPDIEDALRTAFAPVHISALPLCGAWWTLSRFSASAYAFLPEGAYTPDDLLIALVTLEDESGQELARLRAPCRHTGGYIGLIEAVLPDRACVLTLSTQLTLHGDIIEQTALPVYVGERGPLEAALR